MRKYSILIVDDENNVTKLLEKLLTKEGYGALTAASGFEALKIIDSHQVDIVITDIKMPKMSGIDLLGKIKEIDPTIKVILITAFATLETAVEALKMGALDYITKPFDLSDVLLSIERIVAVLEKNEYSETPKEEHGSKENYFLSKSIKMKSAIELMKQVSDTKSTVMIYGETGTGKELAAQIVHDLSIRNDKPFIKVNCAAIPENLLESELFGYEKGAFTGAINSKPGRFELADTGTILLDEVGDITPLMQVKLLRAVQEREFERLGGTKTVKVDVRIIAATNKNLYKMVERKEFREDLFYRLNVIPISIPALREREEDVLQLSNFFLKRYNEIYEKHIKGFAKEAKLALVNYSWPGNVRELQNLIEYAINFEKDDWIGIDIINKRLGEKKENVDNEKPLKDMVADFEKKVINNMIRNYGEDTETKKIIAKKLQISTATLYRKIEE